MPDMVQYDIQNGKQLEVQGGKSNHRPSWVEACPELIGQHLTGLLSPSLH